MNGYVLIKVIEYLLVLTDSVSVDIGDQFLTQVETICSNFGQSSLDFLHVALPLLLHARHPPTRSATPSLPLFSQILRLVWALPLSHLASPQLSSIPRAAPMSQGASQASQLPSQVSQNASQTSQNASQNTSQTPQLPLQGRESQNEGGRRARSLSVDMVVKKSMALNPDQMKDITVHSFPPTHTQRSAIAPITSSIILVDRCIVVAIRLLRLVPSLLPKHKEPLLRRFVTLA